MYKPEFECRGRGVPILKDVEIDLHAEAIIRDFKPELLTEPQPVDIEMFAEAYLKLDIDFNLLSNTGFILGRMVFADTEKIPIYVPERGVADYIFAKRGTIILDSSLDSERNDFQLRSTIGHECGHWIFHKQYFIQDCNQISLFDHLEKITTACRRNDIEGENKVLSSEHDWLEHHAKYFGGSILMPRNSFKLAAEGFEQRDLIRKNMPSNMWDQQLASYLSGIFEVSPASAKIRLRQLGLSMETKCEEFGKQQCLNL